jgi:hypothetical protein
LFLSRVDIAEKLVVRYSDCVATSQILPAADRAIDTERSMLTSATDPINSFSRNKRHATAQLRFEQTRDLRDESTQGGPPSNRFQRHFRKPFFGSFSTNKSSIYCLKLRLDISASRQLRALALLAYPATLLARLVTLELEHLHRA